MNAPADVEVYLAPVRAAETVSALLTDAERRRCERYWRADDQARFASVRALLHRALERSGRLRGGERTELLREPGGRPYLRRRACGCRLPHISLSRSGSWAAVALSEASAVGVDIEHLRAVDQPGFGGLVCTPPEARRLAGLGAAEAAAEKLRIWTLKEARSKADGHGFAADPRGMVATEGAHARALPGLPHSGAAAAVAVRDAPIGTVTVTEVTL